MALGKFKDALKDLKVVGSWITRTPLLILKVKNHAIFLQVCKKAPGDKDAKQKLDECQKIVKRIEFEKAIEVLLD